MLSDNISYIPEQYFNILKGCRENNTIIIGKNLRSLLQNNRHAYLKSDNLQRLYAFCMIRLDDSRIPEIEIIFERLINGLQSTVLRYASLKGEKTAMDIKIKELSAKKVLLQTSDPEIADRLQGISGIKQENDDGQIRNESNWTGSVLKNRLPAVIEDLRSPQYMKYLSKRGKDQLSIDF